ERSDGSAREIVDRFEIACIAERRDEDDPCGELSPFLHITLIVQGLKLLHLLFGIGRTAAVPSPDHPRLAVLERGGDALSNMLVPSVPREGAADDRSASS